MAEAKEDPQVLADTLNGSAQLSGALKGVPVGAHRLQELRELHNDVWECLGRGTLRSLLHGLLA
eukprot:12660867-Alexandrium_andersonii.AAC.1